jgi:polyisoprenoid-binding protein YceI
MEVSENKGCVWLIDPVHTKIRFETKYLLLTSISGWFSSFEGNVRTPGPDFNNGGIYLTVYTNSLYTANEERDKHLRSTDFFDTAHFPTITFISTSIQVTGNCLSIVGDLTIKGITGRIEFTAIYVGATHDPLGNYKAGFEMQTVLDRKDFNISWNQVFDKAGILLSDEVKVSADIQLLRIS